jgi:hypothetical protein
LRRATLQNSRSSSPQSRGRPERAAAAQRR